MVNSLGINVEELPLAAPGKKQVNRVVTQTEKVLKILDVMETKATFFILGSLAQGFPDLIKKIDMAGHEIASYGYENRKVYKHTVNSFREDLTKSLNTLRRLTEKPVVGYRAPGFSIRSDSLWALDILTQEGITYDSSIVPVYHAHYGIPSSPRVHYRIRENLVELPVSTVRFLGNISIFGGMLFRLLPYSLIKSAVEGLNTQGIVVNSYLSVWEIEKKRVQSQLERLLTNFQYAPLEKVIREGRL